MEERKIMKKRSLMIFCLVAVLVLTMAACGGNTKKGAVNINSPADFPGHKIAVQVDTTADYSIDEMIEAGTKNIDVSKYDKVMLCFDDLAIGRVDAVYVDSVVAGFYTKDPGKYKLAWLNDEGEPLGICLQKTSVDLAAAIEAAIDTMIFDGSMAQIAKKHFGTDFTEGLRDVSEAPAIPKDFTTKVAGKLMVGAEVGYPPMEYLDEDGKTFIGFDIDVANRIGELLGLSVETVDTSWDGIFFALEKGEYDCIISSVSITAPRQEKYILTQPYVSNALCIVVKAD
jgi:ABC-type amino acid transport substrate-binding protein